MNFVLSNFERIKFKRTINLGLYLKEQIFSFETNLERTLFDQTTYPELSRYFDVTFELSLFPNSQFIPATIQNIDLPVMKTPFLIYWNTAHKKFSRSSWFVLLDTVHW